MKLQLCRLSLGGWFHAFLVFIACLLAGEKPSFSGLALSKRSIVPFFLPLSVFFFHLFISVLVFLFHLKRFPGRMTHFLFFFAFLFFVDVGVFPWLTSAVMLTRLSGCVEHGGSSQ